MGNQMGKGSALQSQHAPTVMVRTTEEAEMVWDPSLYDEAAKSITGYHIRDGLRNMMQKCCGSHLVVSEDEEYESLVGGDVFAESPPLTPTNEGAARPENHLWAREMMTRRGFLDVEEEMLDTGSPQGASLELQDTRPPLPTTKVYSMNDTSIEEMEVQAFGPSMDTAYGFGHMRMPATTRDLYRSSVC